MSKDRYDSIGLFWHSGKTAKYVKGMPLPMIPRTGWTAPQGYPDLSDATLIAVDVESDDPNLRTKGPGYLRGDAEVVGISVATDTGFCGYFPIAHPMGGNLPKEYVVKWLNRELSRAHQPKVGANLKYDAEALESIGVKIEGKLYDVLTAEALLDENQFTYNLNDTAAKWLGETKEDTALYDWLSRAYGGEAKRSVQGARISQAPVQLVGPYAEQDAYLPIQIFLKQREVLIKEDLFNLFEMECDLIPMLLAMRKRGVKIDMEYAKVLHDDWSGRLSIARKQLVTISGIPNFNVDSNDHLQVFFDKQGVSYPLTAKGNPSFAGWWLESNQHPACAVIREIRSLSKQISTYLDGYIFGMNVNGRIHGQFHSMKSDEGGTVTGRFSASLPNLQNITSRSEFKILRRCFLPDDGEEWVKDDFASIEPRFAVHFSTGKQAAEMKARYRANPRMDFYKVASAAANIERSPAKKVALADLYGRGLASLAAELGVSQSEAKSIKAAMHKANPYLPELTRAVSSVAEKRGYIRTLAKRRGRFPKWEPSDWELAGKPYAKKFDTQDECAQWVDDINRRRQGEGKKTYRSGARRAELHKATNKLCQGSAADFLKKGMVDVWKAGICDVIGAPLMTVHDELDWSDPKTKESFDAMQESRHMMENAYKLTVPIILDRERGPNWLDIKDSPT